jgi:hypothetical protein
LRRLHSFISICAQTIPRCKTTQKVLSPRLSDAPRLRCINVTNPRVARTCRRSARRPSRSNQLQPRPDSGKHISQRQSKGPDTLVAPHAAPMRLWEQPCPARSPPYCETIKLSATSRGSGPAVTAGSAYLAMKTLSQSPPSVGTDVDHNTVPSETSNTCTEHQSLKVLATWITKCSGTCRACLSDRKEDCLTSAAGPRESSTCLGRPLQRRVLHPRLHLTTSPFRAPCGASPPAPCGCRIIKQVMTRHDYI